MGENIEVEEKKVDKKDESWSAASLAWELGYIIAVPLVILALIGRYLDNKLGTSPWFLLVGILIAVFVSSYGIYKKFKDIIEK
ncbi:MAG: AtpZ/AtpI family protein [Parcubacteria group bacterium]|jgi:F0F1-type ATP synthase assembly protein I